MYSSLNELRFSHYSYSFRCLTTETVKYTSFIENLAASKYSMWAQRGKQM